MQTRDNLKRLDVGCGDTITAGYLRMDASKDNPSLDYVGTMDALPFPDNFLEEIRATHVIEHVPLPTAEQALAEFFRALATGGFVTLDTPNFERTARLYLHGGWEWDFAKLTESERAMCSLDGVPNKMLWAIFKTFSTPGQWNTHFANYDGDLLRALCLRAGFKTAEVIQTEPSLMVRAWK